MKKYFTAIILSALILSSCGNTDTADTVTSSTDTTVAAESEVTETKTSTLLSDIEMITTDSLEYIAEPDVSIHFDTYEQFSNSEDLQEALKKEGIELPQISYPVFDTENYRLDEVTMYPSCAYYSFIDTAEHQTISICISFKHFNNYKEMKRYLDNMYNGGNGGFSMGEFSSNDENEVYIAKGNHTSYFRLSQDGLMYSIFCEEIDDEQLYSYCEKIKL